ncbi:hypothetical protein FRC02_005921 [Tulasnella sp. 418]|nr:hypothetical protein FRC02_005921 [Tulasnella sp. 418]
MIGSFTQVRKLDTKQQMKEREEGKANRLNVLKGLSVSDRKRIKGLAYDAAAEREDSNWDLDFSREESPEEETGSDDDVVEEYNVDRSGQTYNVIVNAHRGSYYIVPTKARSNHYRRNHRERVSRENLAWNDQFEDLAIAYLEWKHTGEGVQATLPDLCNDVIEYWEVDVSMWSNYNSCYRISHPDPSDPVCPSQQLVKLGLLPSSPLRPNIAFSLHTLNMYHLLCSRFPRLGIQPFVKALCDSQGRLYDHHLRVQFSNAYDAYLGILRVVDRRINAALGRDSPNWRLLNACAACHHRVENEEPLEHDYLLSIDGNNSLKRFGGSGNADNRIFASDYFLPRADVEEFADVVTQTSRRSGKKGQRRFEENGNDEDEDDVQAELLLKYQYD